MATSNVLTQDEFTHAAEGLTFLVSGAQDGRAGVAPAELNGMRVLMLTVDPEDGKGPAPVAILLDADVYGMVTPVEGKVVVDGQEGVA